MINTVELSSLTKKQLKKLPIHIVVSFQNWVEEMSKNGAWTKFEKFPAITMNPYGANFEDCGQFDLAERTELIIESSMDQFASYV
jgi:hypothetical protein